MKQLLYVLIIFTTLIGCTSETKEKASSTYFGGEIINPLGNYLLIIRDLETVDTIPLDRRNRFMYEFKDFEEGLYQFRHGEHQVFHLEEGDSLMLRVNTKEFDESISFSGYGAERSNYLIDMFLHWENEGKNFSRNYQKSPENFKIVLDSLDAIKVKKLEKLLAKKEFSEDFQEIARMSTFLGNYQRLESYPLAHYSKDKMAFIESLPSNFYSFRESLDLNNANLRNLFSYQRYINAFLDQEAFKSYGAKGSYNRFSYLHNLRKAEIIDSLITEPIQRDRWLNRIAREFIANSNNQLEVDLIFQKLETLAVHPATKNSIASLNNNHKSMQAGHSIPEVSLVNAAGVVTTLSEQIKAPTVIYFWSDLSKSRMSNSHLKAADLKSKYPEFDFIGININDDHKRWVHTLNSKKYNPECEFRLSQSNEGLRKLVVSDLNKTIVLDKNGVILNSHANLHHSRFENDLLAYLNQ